MAGYQLIATHSCGQVLASYAEADNPNRGAEKCFIEFPTEDGYTFHRILNTETHVEYVCRKKEPDPETNL